MKLSVLPENCQSVLAAMGINGVERIFLLRQRKDHVVYRFQTKAENFVLKCFQTPPPVKEIQVYALLQKYGVPTLPCRTITDNAILLDDLDYCKAWKRAGEDDMKSSSTGIAVGNWYQNLHTAGFEVLSSAIENLEYLEAWVDVIRPDMLESVGHKLEVGNTYSWKLALSHCRVLKEKYRSFPQTFNYNDFAAENLALSSIQGEKLRAVVYDYDQFSIGAVCSDWRNITCSLQGDALAAFIDTYGEGSESERRLDDVLSVLYGLIIAARRDNLPKWAIPLLRSIENGDLEKKIAAALEIV